MKYRFLIYISHTYALPIGIPLQEEIKRRNFDMKWFSELDPPKSYFPENGDLIAHIEDAIDYEPHIVLCITDVVADFLPGLKVQIFHGFLANKHSDAKGHFRIRGLFDLYCTQGPSTTIPFKEIQQKKKYFLVRETGWSKVDPLFKIEEKERNKPTILLSSTFSPKYSWLYNTEVIEEIKRLSKTGEFEFLAVLHPKMDKEKIAIIKKLQHENFKFYDTTNIIPLFREADIMFSDTTSAITEFILQKKPVVTFRNNKPAPHLINITNPGEIEDAIRKAISSPEDLLSNINAYIHETHPYFDGKSSERVISTCIEVLLAEKQDLAKKPLNLVRRYQLRKKLGYFTLKSYRKPFTLNRKD
ncbi:UDP-N-acetylglucosamine 2-epimerase [Zunongwangia endophytica]|uniref:UDP-N-acetylglucosamine 2-epimerase n=1 Tax=Zunongwangia endophytica TaxID=1808945 RepID=A0ABV8HBR3_9FLAO|nr:UDP-N-acetylglucosamine 2-epimerase [Zunongwangia endophytica]MDN3593376.1 UDP-N-acetylglucosamine 2-epimerase [Zunongwangia endophytica]